MAVLVTLVLAAQDQTPTASPRGRATVKPAQVLEPRGKPMGNRHRATAEGHEPETAERREPEENAGRRETRGRRAKGTNPAGKRETGGKPAGNPEVVRSGPKPPGESRGIWGRTHLRRRWRSPGRLRLAARLAPALLAPRTSRLFGCPPRAGPGRGVSWIRDQSTASGGWEYVPAGRDAHLVPGVCRPLTELGRIRIQNGCRTAVTQGYTPRRLKLRLKR